MLLVGDDPLARSGLAALLAGEPGLLVVGQAAPGEEAAAAERLRPDAVLWDLGLEADAALKRLEPSGDQAPPAVALLPHDDLAAEALAAGARGLLPRNVPPAQLAAALRAVAAGLLVLDDALAAPLLRPRPADPDLVEPLTARELEVLQLLAQGLSNRAIGDRLGITESTAKFHVTAILGKLAAAGRTDAVVKAARLGLVLL